MFGFSGSGSNGMFNYKLGNNESSFEVASCIKADLGFSLTGNIV